MPRCIFHVDVNSAFLSWTAVKRLSEEPGALDLRTVPSAVGGDVRTRHGVITAKSIPAKAYGIKTGEPVVKALQKCPALILVPSDFETYRKYSRAFVSVLRKYAPVVEQVSIDEAFCDMTGTEERYPEDFPLGAAKLIRDEIRDTLGFTVNVGISENRLLAKMASDFEKPDRIHTLWPSEIREKMWPLPIRELFGCGAATAEKLREMGIHTIGDAANTPRELLITIAGESAGNYIWRSANGISDSPVTEEVQKAKSYSNETTTQNDITEANFETDALPILRKLSDKVAARMKRDGVRAFTITVSVKTGEFKRHSRQTRLVEAADDGDILFGTSEKLLRELCLGEDGLFARGQGLRLIGVGGSSLEDESFRQLNLFSWAAVREEEEKKKAEEKAKEDRARALREERERKAAEKKRKLDDMMKRVKTRYGEQAIRVGARDVPGVPGEKEGE